MIAAEHSEAEMIGALNQMKAGRTAADVARVQVTNAQLESPLLLDQFDVVKVDWNEVTGNPPRSVIPLLTVTT